MKLWKALPGISLLILLLLLPNVAYSESEAYRAGTVIGHYFWGVVYLFGFIKCISIMRRETTSTLCALSLAFVLSGLLAMTVGSMLKDIHIALFYSGVVIALLLVLSGFVLAIVGLVLYGKHENYIQGKKQAITAMVLTLLVVGLGVFGFVSKFQEREAKFNSLPQKSEYVFEEYNFKFVPGGKKYVSMEAKLVSEDATLVLQGAGQVYFMVIAETPGPGVFDIKGLENIVTTNLEAGASKVSDWQREELEINGYSGVVLKADALIGNYEMSYIFWLYEHNGYLFQLVNWGSLKKKENLHRDYLGLFSGFELISDDRIANTSDEPLENFESHYGYKAGFSESQWNQWESLQEDYPGAEFGGEIGDATVFLVVPYCYGKNKPHDGAIQSALLGAVGIEIPNNNLTELGSVQLGELKGETQGYHWEEDGFPMHARLTRVIAENCSYLLASWTNMGEERLDEYMEDVHSRIVFEGVGFAPKGKKSGESQATFDNSVGLYYYKIDNFEKALEFFSLAQQAVPDYVTYLNNTLDTFNRLKHYREGLDYYLEYSGENASVPEVLSWKAWFEDKLGLDEDAIKSYERAFSGGYKNDVDLLGYVDKLIQLESFERASNVLIDYAEHKNSVDLLRKEADIKSALNQYDEALILLNKAQKGRPFNSDIVFEKIYIYDYLGQYEEILEQSALLFEEGYSTVGVFFQKGKAEFNLGRYVEAKNSIESALERSPGNETIKDYLARVASHLGQGDSASISTKIDLVPLPELPESPKADIEQENLYDSFYLLRAKAFRFRKGETLRATSYKTIKVLNMAGVKRFSSIQADFDPVYENAYVNSLVVKDDQGKVVGEGKRSDYYILDKESEFADTDKTIHIPVPGLQPGYTIELVLSTETLGVKNEFDYELVYLSSSRPVRQSLVLIEGDVKGLKISENEVRSPKRAGSSLLWSVNYPRPYLWEPLEKKFSEELSFVSVSGESKTWSELGEEYLISIKDRLNSSATLDEDNRKNIKTLKTDKIRIKLLTKFVQNKITYKALEFGVRGLIPNSAEQTLKNNFGDCKDHSVLLQNLFLQEKFEAHLALVNTENKINPGMPSLSQFNHMVVALKKGDKYEFYDTTDKDLSSDGRIPIGLGGKKALILDQDGSRLVDIPDYPESGSEINIIRNITLQKNGSALVKEQVSLSSYMGASWRKFLKGVETSRQLEWAQRFVSEKQSDVKVNDVTITNLYEIDKPIQVELEYLVPKSRQGRSNTFTDYTPWEGYALKVESVRNREKAFEIRYPYQLNSEVIVSANGGVRLGSPVVAKQKKKEVFGTYEKFWARNKNVLTKKYSIRGVSGVYEADKYEAYSAFMKAARDAVSDTISFEQVN